MSRTLPYIVICLLVACGDDDAGRSEGTEVGDCTDRADNDGDGLFDCDDDGCAGSPDCRDGGVVDSGVDGSVDTGEDSDTTTDGGPDGNVGAACTLPLGSECGEGAWCVPDPDEEDLGICQLTGAGEDGDSCTTQSDCAESMVCSRAGVCRRSCALGTEECTAGYCEFFDGSARVGYCVRICTVFGEDPVCPEGEWCNGAGCLPAGTGAEDDACGIGLPFCAAGLGCFLDTCQPRCQPGAAEGSPGDTCEGTDVCLSYCYAACDYDGAAACPPDEYCRPEELFGEDVCTPLEVILDHGDSCTDAGLIPGDYCGPFQTCLGGEEPSVCADLCRATVQAYGTTNHPDCSDTAATCTDPGVPDVDYGYCDSP